MWGFVSSYIPILIRDHSLKTTHIFALYTGYIVPNLAQYGVKLETH